MGPNAIMKTATIPRVTITTAMLGYHWDRKVPSPVCSPCHARTDCDCNQKHGCHDAEHREEGVKDSHHYALLLLFFSHFLDAFGSGGNVGVHT